VVFGVVGAVAGILQYIYLTAWTARAYLGRELEEGTPVEIMRRKFGKTLLTGFLIMLIFFAVILVAFVPLFLVGMTMSGGNGAGFAVLATLFAIALYVLMFYLMVSLAFSFPAVILEDIGASDALRRSFVLVKGERWQVFGTYLLIGAIVYAIVIILTLVISLVAGTTGLISSFDPDQFASFGLGFGAVIYLFSVLFTPLYMFPSILLYFSARVKKEDFHLSQISNQWEAASAEVNE
jgi:membrane-anchored glycerophosphoryl diester phosphodiesterase (GDPDase)